MDRHFWKLPKAVFQVRPSHMIVPHCCWLCLLFVQSITEKVNIPGFHDMADNAHILVQHGNTNVQPSKGCFPVQTIKLDRFALLVVVPTFSTVDNWEPILQDFAIWQETSTFYFDMVRHFLKLPKAVFHFRLWHMIVPHCCWQCLLFLQSTT